MGRLLHFKIDWFLAGLGAAAGLAWVFPAPGAAGGWLHPEMLARAGVALVFFLHGLGLSFAALKAGAVKWRLHLVVQGCTFLFFPLLGILLLWLAGGRVGGDLRTGIFYLCALPSTVSSSVAMTAAARGNVAAAVFNASLSGVLGVVLTPLWMGWLPGSGGHALPLGPVIVDLVCWLVLPLVAGQVARRWLGAWAGRRGAWVNAVDRGIILLLVHLSFCDSVARGVWAGQGWLAPVVAVAAAGGVFGVVLLAAGAVCDRLGFAPADRIAAVFCGSKKSLASGVPMAQIIFAGDPGLGVILLPVMVYHPLQLVVCGVLAGRWARRRGE
jgi:sodium/bile acid cotransporter 7